MLTLNSQNLEDHIVKLQLLSWPHRIMKREDVKIPLEWNLSKAEPKEQYKTYKKTHGRGNNKHNKHKNCEDFNSALPETTKKD